MKWFCLVFIVAMVFTEESVFVAGAASAVVVPKQEIVLFDGKSLDGWFFYAKDGSPIEKTWTIRDGVIHCEGAAGARGYLRTLQAYADYVLTVEWRFLKPDNTGVIVHANGPEQIWQKGVECQGAHRQQGDMYLWGGLVAAQPFTKGNAGIAALTPAVENPVGEWNTYQVQCAGDTIVIRVNGTEVNRISGCSVTSGWIGLQSEGAEIEVRRVTLSPLPTPE